MRLRSDGLVVRTVGDEAVLLCLQTSTYFSTAESGAVLVTRLMEGDTQHDELVDILVDLYGIDRVAAARDVDAFLRQLDDDGLLQAG
jgi:hypothetical protein